MGFPEEDGTVEQEKKLQFDDMNEASVYIAEKMGAIEEAIRWNETSKNNATTQ